jgi:hypothetical protein
MCAGCPGTHLAQPRWQACGQRVRIHASDLSAKQGHSGTWGGLRVQHCEQPLLRCKVPSRRTHTTTSSNQPTPHLQVVDKLVCLINDLLLQQLGTVMKAAQHSTAQHSTPGSEPMGRESAM